jgi:RsiW-degrading membrane proteinase PrsW (M82 family)
MNLWWLNPVQFLLGVTFVGLAAVGWFAYFRSKEDGRRAVRWLRLAAIAGGCMSVLAALSAFQLVGRLGFDANWTVLVEGPLVKAGLAALLIGIIEEGAKLLSVACLAGFSRHIYRPRVGLVLAACTGVGFAMAESVSLLSTGHLTPVEALARAAASPITHALFAAPFGVGLAELVLTGRWRNLVLGFSVSALSHGLYDLLLARPDVPRWAAASVVLALWIWLMYRTASRFPGRTPRTQSLEMPIVAVPSSPRHRRP